VAGYEGPFEHERDVEIKPGGSQLGMLPRGRQQAMRKAAGMALAIAVLAGGPIPLGPREAGRDALAQEGHPLSGTWTGDWEVGEGQRTHLTLVMSWDGKAVAGLVNPGPEAIPLTRVAVDWATWTLRIDGEQQRGDGKAVTMAAEGRLEDIGSPRRRIVGTWTQAEVTGPVTLTRE
jgi:hypothetical protein